MELLPVTSNAVQQLMRMSDEKIQTLRLHSSKHYPEMFYNHLYYYEHRELLHSFFLSLCAVGNIASAVPSVFAAAPAVLETVAVAVAVAAVLDSLAELS